MTDHTLPDAPGRELTGRKVLIITLCAFTVIIGANMALLFSALGSFPGLVVKNSYVASQSFDAERESQQALGWEAAAAYAPGQLVLSLTDATGAPARYDSLSALIGRPTHVKDDQVLSFVAGTDGTLMAPALLDRGHWQMHLQITAPDGTRFRQTLAVFVTNDQADAYRLAQPEAPDQ